MKKLIILILIFNVFCSCEKEKKEIYKYNKNIKLTSEIQKLVNELHIYPSISGNKTNESENKTYKNLLDIATDQELVELTDYKSARIRCYAFRGLVEREYLKVKEIFYNIEIAKGVYNQSINHTFSLSQLSRYYCCNFIVLN